MKKFIWIIIFLVLVSFNCKSRKEDEGVKKVTLTLGAYTVPKEVYQKEIIPAFKKFWKIKTGQEVK